MKRSTLANILKEEVQRTGFLTGEGPVSIQRVQIEPQEKKSKDNPVDLSSLGGTQQERLEVPPA